MRRMPPLLFVLLLASACQHPNKSDLLQLDRMAKEPDPRSNAAETIACDARDLICVRLLVARGAACTRLTEAPETATRIRSRTCALDDFRAAQRLLPEAAPAEDRLRTLEGLADAQKIARDNSADTAAAAALNEEVATTAAALRPVPGGAPFARYFEADAKIFRAQRGGMAVAEACQTLAGARDQLPGADAPPRLAARVGLLRTAIGAAMRPPARSCA